MFSITDPTINDERIGYNSYIGLEPLSQTAASTYFPYGAFQDTTDQSLATITATGNITLNTTDTLIVTYIFSITFYSASRMVPRHMRIIPLPLVK